MTVCFEHVSFNFASKERPSTNYPFIPNFSTTTEAKFLHHQSVRFVFFFVKKNSCQQQSEIFLGKLIISKRSVRKIMPTT